MNPDARPIAPTLDELARRLGVRESLAPGAGEGRGEANSQVAGDDLPDAQDRPGGKIASHPPSTRIRDADPGSRKA